VHCSDFLPGVNASGGDTIPEGRFFVMCDPPPFTPDNCKKPGLTPGCRIFYENWQNPEGKPGKVAVKYLGIPNWFVPRPHPAQNADPRKLKMLTRNATTPGRINPCLPTIMIQPDPSPKNTIDRRDFLKKSALGAGIMVLPGMVAGQSAVEKPPSERLNIAIIGVGGKGRGPVMEGLRENVVALCDVDMASVEWARANSNDSYHAGFADALSTHEKKGARWFTDYRVMFEEMADKIDAVIISTPDHMHYPIGMSAINLGKHIYLEKPLTHTVGEARAITAAARKKGVVSQMGNQGHSNNGTRLVREWVQAGVIGKVREVHSWTNRPAVFWKQGVPSPDHSRFVPVVPDGLDWDLWQGVAPRRAYDPSIVPFHWRAVVDYGCGALGDMACHIMDSAFWALDLGSPTHIEAACTTLTGYSYPISSIVTFEFPARGDMPALTYKWYDGDLRPSIPNLIRNENAYAGGFHANGTFIIGDSGIIQTDEYSAQARILPESRFQELRPSLPPRSLRRIRGSHLEEFFNAIRENREASSDFSYAGPFTETVLLGCIAQRLGRRLQFDGTKGQFLDDDEANSLIDKHYPEGWILG
jgi:predicted dehydrogenase